jgi:hypothetical protein
VDAVPARRKLKKPKKRKRKNNISENLKENGPWNNSKGRFFCIITLFI